MPLASNDWFYADRITYSFRASSVYNGRFLQWRRMKELLGRHRALVGEGKSRTRELFLRHITQEQIRAIRRVFNVGPIMFWRAASGKVMLPLPPRLVQGALDFGE